MASDDRIERRTIGRQEARVAARGRTLAGYAAIFNVDSVDLGGFTESIAPGAFAGSLRGPGSDVRALFDHDSGRLLGRQKSGTLRLREDARGLAFEDDAPDTTDGRDALELVGRGDLDGMSFAFTTIEDRWSTKGKLSHRELLAVEVHEISLVTFPAYPDASVALRSLRRASTCDAGRALTEMRRRRLRMRAARCA